jgi:hypothetical protein
MPPSPPRRSSPNRPPRMGICITITATTISIRPSPRTWPCASRRWNRLLVEKGVVDSRGARRRRRQLRNQDRPAQWRACGGACLGRPCVQEAAAGRSNRGDRQSSDIQAVKARTWWFSRIPRRSTNLVVCTLCSCYPWPVPRSPAGLGTNPRLIARAPSLTLEGCCASSASTCPKTSRSASGTVPRRSVPRLPERPAGTDHLSEEALAALVTRDSMIGVTKVPPQAGGRA